ncbi:type VII toxin-antitoxin system MntA family adenylyltransferase antitoxin [Phytopseudomonas dryadis]|uniref:DNA polymerase III subunit beta n=1 Tax=Phytopseudomonas dryadis TaxID=2487520 RepID=A0A4Q9R2U3_9GAMM|nr:MULTISPECIES: nucleotidyltransferase domain-containing protein [Pseudomonas]TBU93892.1 DNA polymerase III subunit beta [Pseudomonas dryadis]TBV07946.1 DNA polymerase III subunit beta [Pseudomonas dryadis]TBV19341.1 DNA polymerase III subunit beta [Pseudomonas sp. FRB 230]
MTIEAVEACLAYHPDIKLAYVFGSIASGKAGANSDVDVAVLTTAKLNAEYKARLISDIASATGRPVDLIDLATVGEPLLGQILRHGVRIRGDAVLHAQWVSRHVLSNEDFMPYVERMLAERRQAWIG